MLWLQALIFPYHVDRMQRLRKAIRYAKENRPNIVAGDIMDVLPNLLAKIPENAVPVVYHSFVLYQFSEEDRQKVFDILNAASRQRDLYRLAIEWISSNAPYIRLDSWETGKHQEVELATCNPHGRWLKWNL